MLAHHAQLNAGTARGFNHLAGGFKIGRNRLLDLDMFAGFGANAYRLKPEIRECADIDVIDVRMAANLFVGLDELGLLPIGKRAARFLIDVGTHRDAISDLSIGFRVFVGNRASTNHANSHFVTSGVLRVS